MKVLSRQNSCLPMQFSNLMRFVSIVSRIDASDTLANLRYLYIEKIVRLAAYHTKYNWIPSCRKEAAVFHLKSRFIQTIGIKSGFRVGLLS